MQRFASPKSDSPPWRIIGAVATVLATCLLVAIGLVLRGCMNEHHRPDGHADTTFAVSPRGDAIVFNATGEGGRDLYLLELREFRAVRIAGTPEYEVDPEFSPDGKSIVFAAGKPGDRADHIFLRSLDAKTVKQLTAEDANDSSPSFSPDGSLITFTRDDTYEWGGLASNWSAGGVICVMATDGSGLRRITRDSSLAIHPRFSADGKSIVFWSDGGSSTVSADGSQPPRPLGGLAGKEAAVYSRDGRSIAFSRGRYAGDCRIFVARADGTGLTELAYPGKGPLAAQGGGCIRPYFTPDGKQIFFFFESWPDGLKGSPKENLWEAGIDGGDSREIAGYNLFDDPLHWRPVPPTPVKRP